MKSILFDLDDTIYAREDPFGKAFYEVFGRKILVGKKDISSVYDDFLRYGLDLFEESMNGTVSMEALYIDRIRKTLLALGEHISDETALTFQECYAKEQACLTLSPTMRDVLDECARQADFTGIVSNGESVHQRAKFETLGLSEWIRPEHFLPTGDLGINKPNPAVLLEAQKRWNLVPDSTWYIGDSLEHDIVCAAKVGWHTLWLNRHHEPESSLPELTACSEEDLLLKIRTLFTEKQ